MGKKNTVIVNKDGTINWIPMGSLFSKCPLNLKNFPMDEQICTLEFECWESTYFMNFTEVSVDVMDQGSFIDSTQLWILTGLEAVRYENIYDAELENSYSHCSVRIHVKRSVSYYIGTILLPLAALCIIQNAAFFMEPHWPDRPVFSITVLLAFSILQSVFEMDMPKTSGVVYLSINISAQFSIGMILTLYYLIICCVANNNKTNPKKSKGTLFGCLNIGMIRLIDLIMAICCVTISCIINAVVYFLIATDTKTK